MFNKKIAALILLCCSVKILSGAPGDSILIKNLKDHIYYLASDKLQGRNTGSKGEKLAYKYIIRQYKKIGLSPKAESGSYLQSFTFSYGKKIVGKNEVIINGTKLILNEDYYPINFSGSGTVKGKIADVGFGIIAPAISYDSYKNLTNLKDAIFLIECSTPEGDDPHSAYAQYADINSKIQNAINKGAKGIIFTNTQLNADDLFSNLDINVAEAAIPIIFVKSASLKHTMKENFNGAAITVHLEKVELTGHNVIAFLDNGAANTVVIGAHFDHLGYGEYGNSLYRGTPQIHNGADDNASGTAGVIEVARFLKNNEMKEKTNFIFLNFSGEELGLIGSKYWVNHDGEDTSRITYMINMDMIGRYNPEKGIEISGLGTSPEAFDFIRGESFDSLKCKFGDSGTGPSDQTSFYYANIPVLNFFTGSHEDYHKPSDDADKINYSGEAEILRYIESLVMKLDAGGKYPFSKTRETDMGDVPQFRVRLGIIPDYLFEGPGLRVDGVDEGKPADAAGIKKGDIIISLGDHKVSDIMEYMKALAAFKKGDSTAVVVRRGDKDLELRVTF